MAQKALKMSRYCEDARELARRMTEWSKNLEDTNRRFVVCISGGPGIMEAANRGASDAKGLNIGLNINLPMEQHDNPYISRELALKFHYFFMRKFWFIFMAKALVISPGGFGTVDELFETMTLITTHKMKKKMHSMIRTRSYRPKCAVIPNINYSAAVFESTGVFPTSRS
jgi:predicted Rossmann-fold nucleotide-binding protein